MFITQSLSKILSALNKRALLENLNVKHCSNSLYQFLLYIFAQHEYYDYTHIAKPKLRTIKTHTVLLTYR
jgi:hypothetical protein